MLKFALVVLNWNNAKDTLECLQSIEKIDYPNYQVIVIDNGSTDNSVSQIKTQFPKHVLIETKENLGYAEGNNRGIAEVQKQKADLIFLLNNDTIVSPQLLKEIAKAAIAHPKAGAFGPKIYFYDEPATIWYAGGGVDPKTGRCFHVGCGSADFDSRYRQLKQTDYICGCALAIRSQVLQEVGPFSSEFFLLWEEIDWCYRMRQKGYNCLFVPRAKLWHKVSSSFVGGNRGPMWQYFYFRNRLLFHKKHSPFSKRFRKGDFVEFFDLMKTALHPKTPKHTRKESKAALYGLWDYFTGRFGKGRLAKFLQK